MEKKPHMHYLRADSMKPWQKRLFVKYYKVFNAIITFI